MIITNVYCDVVSLLAAAAAAVRKKYLKKRTVHNKYVYIID